MRRLTLALALAVGISGCFEVGQRVMPEASPSPRSEPSPEPTSEPSPEPSASPIPLPLPRLPFVKRLAGEDRLYLFDPLSQDVIALSDATTGGPILNPFYFERRGEPRILFNSGGVIDCPEGSGIAVPDITNFGAYVYDPIRRLRIRLSDDDYFLSVATADGSLTAHLDVTVFPPPRRIILVLKGSDEPFDEEAIVAPLDQEPGVLVDLSLAAMGRWLTAVKGPKLDETCRFPPPVAGTLYLYDLLTFRLVKLSALYDLPPVQAATLSPTGQQIILLAGDQLLRLDRVTGQLDPMAVLNQARGDGRFARVRFLAGDEHVFYLEHRPYGKPSRILAYDWNLQLLSPLPLVNGVDDPTEIYLAPPYP